MMRYIVTDPCYIVPDATWEQLCDQYLANDDFRGFNKAVADELTKLSGRRAYVEDTGFGDWSNSMEGRQVVTPNFVADAGMVCVVAWTPEIAKLAEGNYGKDFVKGSAALLELAEPIRVRFDTSDPNWTIVKITDAQGNYCVSEEQEDEDEDEDDGWGWSDDDDYDDDEDEDEDY